MTRRTLTIIAGLAFAPLAASAQPGNANAVLREQMQALRTSGFGMAEVQVPQAPAAVKGVLASNQVDEITEALAALRRETKAESNVGGEAVRALGFDFNGEKLPVKHIVTPKIEDVIRWFNVSTFLGTTDIIMQDFRKVNGRQELRSYLISTSGALEAAALTVKVNGKLVAEKVPVSAAQAGCREQLEFWTRYYRENLKNP